MPPKGKKKAKDKNPLEILSEHVPNLNTKWSINKNGQLHNITYTAEIQVKDKVYRGEGRKQQDAKKDAAQKAVEENYLDQIPKAQQPTALHRFTEMFPRIKFHHECRGPENTCMHTTSIEVDGQRFIGNGSTIQEAKRRTAQLFFDAQMASSKTTQPHNAFGSIAASLFEQDASERSSRNTPEIFDNKAVKMVETAPTPTRTDLKAETPTSFKKSADGHFLDCKPKTRDVITYESSIPTTLQVILHDMTNFIDETGGLSEAGKCSEQDIDNIRDMEHQLKEQYKDLSLLISCKHSKKDCYYILLKADDKFFQGFGLNEYEAKWDALQKILCYDSSKGINKGALQMDQTVDEKFDMFSDYEDYDYDLDYEDQQPRINPWEDITCPVQVRSCKHDPYDSLSIDWCCFDTQHSQITDRLNQRITCIEDLDIPEYSAEYEISDKSSETNRDILRQLSAMANTSGGFVKIRLVKGMNFDSFQNGLKDRFSSKIPQFLLKMEFLKEKNEIIVFVKKSNCLLTYDFCMYQRHQNGVQKVTKADQLIAIRRNVIEETPNIETILGEPKGYTYGSKAQARESINTEYKCYKQALNINDLLKHIRNDQEPIMKSLLGFANTRGGGHLIIGVEDDVKKSWPWVIRGQRIAEDDSMKSLSEKITEAWQGGTESKRLWGDSFEAPPLHIKFCKVLKTPNQEHRILIDIMVKQIPNGLYASKPECYYLNDQDKIVTLCHEDWIKTTANNINKHVPKKSHNVLRRKRERYSKSKRKFRGSFKENQVILEGPDAELSWTDHGQWIQDTVPETSIATRDFLPQIAESKFFKDGEEDIKVYPEETLIEHLVEQDCHYELVKELISQIRTGHSKQKGIIIVSRSWLELLRPMEKQALHENHVLDFILILSTGVAVVYALFASNLQDPKYKQYSLKLARCFKREFLEFLMKIHMFETITDATDLDCSIPAVCCFKDNIDMSMQTFGKQKANEKLAEKYKIFVSHILLHGQTPLRNPLGEEFLKALTSVQIKTILDTSVIDKALIEGPPGCGKTIIALTVCHLLLRTIEKSDILYIATTVPFQKFVEYQNVADVIVVLSVDELLEKCEQGKLDKYKAIIVDDAQHLSGGHEKQWEGIFCFVNAMMKCCKFYIFFDADYQAYKSSKQSTKLKAEFLSCNWQSTYRCGNLNEVHRNTRKVFNFMKVNIPVGNEVQCNHAIVGDDVVIRSINNLDKSKRSHGLIKRVEHLAKPHKSNVNLEYLYKYEHIAILVHHSDHTVASSEADKYRKVFQQYFSQSNPTNAQNFPVKGVIIDTLDNFAGLEARVCIVVICGEKTEYMKLLTNYKFRLYAASRGICRVEFVIKDPLDSSIATELKFSSLDELFSMQTKSLLESAFAGNLSQERTIADVTDGMPTEWFGHQCFVKTLVTTVLQSTLSSRSFNKEAYNQRKYLLTHFIKDSERINYMLESAYAFTIELKLQAQLAQDILTCVLGKDILRWHVVDSWAKKMVNLSTSTFGVDMLQKALDARKDGVILPKQSENTMRET